MISCFGDIFFTTFISWKIYEKTENLKYLTVSFSGSIILKTIFSLFSGKIADTFNRKIVLIINDIIHGFILIILIIFFALNLKIIIFILIGFIFLKAFFETNFSICFLSYINDIIPENDIIKIRALIDNSTRITIIFGSLIAGLAVDLLSIHIALILDAATFFISAIFIFLVPYYINKQLKIDPNEKKQKLNIIKNLFIFIYNNVIKSKFIVQFIIIVFLGNLVYGFIPTMLPIIAAKKITNSATFLGLFNSSLMIGEVIGLYFISTKIGNYISRCFIIGTIGTALSFLIIFTPIISFVNFIIIFLFYGCFDSLTTGYFSYTVNKIKSDVRGRVIGIINSIILLSSPLGMIIGTFLIEMKYGIYYSLMFCSIVLLFVSLLFIISPITKKIVINN